MFGCERLSLSKEEAFARVGCGVDKVVALERMCGSEQKVEERDDLYYGGRERVDK